MIYIKNTDHILGKEDAAEWMSRHIVISKADLEKIKTLVKKKGLSKEFRALGIMMHELTPSC